MHDVLDVFHFLYYTLVSLIVELVGKQLSILRDRFIFYH